MTRLLKFLYKLIGMESFFNHIRYNYGRYLLRISQTIGVIILANIIAVAFFYSNDNKFFNVIQQGVQAGGIVDIAFSFVICTIVGIVIPLYAWIMVIVLVVLVIGLLKLWEYLKGLPKKAYNWARKCWAHSKDQ